MQENKYHTDQESEICRFILKNPGCYLRSIGKQLGIAMGTTQYHLNRLEKMGIITSKKRFHRSYFPSSVNLESDKKILQIISQERTRQIILQIIERRRPTQIELYKHIGIPRSSIGWHLQQLLAIDIVEEIRDGRYKRYQIAGGNSGYLCKRIICLMKNHYPSLWDQWTDRIMELFFLSQE